MQDELDTLSIVVSGLVAKEKEISAKLLSLIDANADFRKESLHFNTTLSKDERHGQGIYFTPRAVREKLFSVLDKHSVQPMHILEPCFGSGEFIHDSLKKYPTAKIVGVEKNTELFESFGKHLKVDARNQDYLIYKADRRADLIIGNPPYFVVKEKTYGGVAVATGRGNIFALFIYKAISEDLADGGILAFILPTSFYNCTYYQPCRDYLIKNTEILHLENLEKGGFYGTAQDTMLLVLRKVTSSSKQFVFRMDGRVYITPFYKELQQLVAGALTLKSLGLTVKTGEIVWNQYKDVLDDVTGTLVIYSANIVEGNRIEMDGLGGQKKQYIRSFTGPPTKGPAIVVPRGYGNNYKFMYAVIKEGIEFYGENHVNVITCNDIKIINRVCKSFEDERPGQFIKMFIGNGALSKTELESGLPIF